MLYYFQYITLVLIEENEKNVIRIFYGCTVLFMLSIVIYLADKKVKNRKYYRKYKKQDILEIEGNNNNNF